MPLLLPDAAADAAADAGAAAADAGAAAADAAADAADAAAEAAEGSHAAVAVSDCCNWPERPGGWRGEPATSPGRSLSGTRECRSPSAKRAPRKSDRDWIEETYGEYLADLTADTTGVFPSLTVTGQSVAEIIQGWFHDDRCTAFIVLREQEPVGFAVVQRSAPGAARTEAPLPPERVLHPQAVPQQAASAAARRC